MRKPSVGWRRLAAGLALLSGFTGAASLASADDTKGSLASEASLTSERITLSNGLTVLLAPDATAQRTALQITIDLGAKDDPRDVRGMSQIVEALLDDPSTRHVPRALRTSLFKALGIEEWKTKVDAGLDHTEIALVVPPSDVALALWIESDRIGFLLDGVDEEAVRKKRASVVPSGWDFDPTFRLGRAALFGDAHPYGGELDVSKATSRAVREHIRKYFVPRGTVLALAGSFDPKAVKAQIEDDFGPFADVAKPAAPAVPKATPAGEKRVRGEANVAHPSVGMLWATPAFLDEDDATFDGLALVLAERLSAKHVDGSKVATEVQASQASAKLGSAFVVHMTAAKGHSADEMERLLDDEVEKLRKEGPTAAEATRAARTWLTTRAVNLTRTANRADVLTSFFLVKSDPNFLRSWLGAYEGLTASKLRAAAEKHLAKTQRVTVTLLPNPLAPPWGRAIEGGAM